MDNDTVRGVRLDGAGYLSLCLDGTNSYKVQLVSHDNVGITVTWSDGKRSFYPWTAVHRISEV